ncbi:hypothetical protein PR048_028488 [Dryococelus australis]|uniref:Reverse transcriptase domain-containing protein n=1 Tax=Dryococelus australis TaxID=614101 RepID=A0ABQ9GAQ1_9NEOP|nr:hypothetical protein PR048_028488 [Dryococelus australis]
MRAKRHADAIAGTTLRDPVSIAAAFLDHYSRLYSEQRIDNDPGAPFVRSITNRLSEYSSNLPQCEFTYEEVALIVEHTPKNKSPGIDGIPTITLLCTDYKILELLFANRLKHVLSDIIGPEQCCAARNNSIIQGVAVLRDVQLIAKSTPGPESLLSIDLDKAFDRVNWNLFDRIMLHVGFPPPTIAIYKLCEEVQQHSYLLMVGWEKALPIHPPYTKGVPYLCLNSYSKLNPSYEHSTRNSTMVSLLGQKQTLTCIGYADDVMCIVRAAQVISAKTTLLDTKSEAHALRQVSPYVKIDKLRALGIEFMQNSEQMIKCNCYSVVHKVRGSLLTARLRNINTIQRAYIVNTYLLPQLWHVAHLFPMSKATKA